MGSVNQLCISRLLHGALLVSVLSTCMSKKETASKSPPVETKEEEQPFDPITVLPGDCLQELFTKYSTDDEKLDQNGFAELLHNLGLGEVQEDEDEDHATDHDDHDDVDHHDDHAKTTSTKSITTTQRSEKRYKRDAKTTTSKSLVDDKNETSTVPGKTKGVLGTSGKSTTTSSPKSITNATLHHGFHTDHHMDNYHVTQCLSAEAVLNIFDDDTALSGLTKNQFFQVCPVLLQQLDSRACVKFDVNREKQEIVDPSLCNMEEPAQDASGKTHVWGYAIAAVTLISMVSIFCILVVPCMQRFPILYARLLSFLVAMAVGTLSGDAVMHLMPHAFGFHGHKEEAVATTPLPGCGDMLTTTDDHGHEEEGEETLENNVVIKGLVVLMGIFSFFVIEQCMQMCRNCRQKRHKPSDNGSSYTQLKPREQLGAKLCNHSNATDRFSTLVDPAAAQLDAMLANDEKPDPNKASVVYKCKDERRGSQTSDNSHHSQPAVTICVHSDAQIHISPQPKYHEHSHAGGDHKHDYHEHPHADGDHKHEHNDHQHSHDGYQSGDHHHENHNHSDDNHGHAHHGHSHDVPPPSAGIATLAWIVVMGDGLHNFCDGLVIGAAFADSIVGGLSTAIAVMCHELPHELGDFAVMLKGGMSVKQALAFQGVSSILAYVGMAIGVAMGNITSVSLWIFALAAGMFLYIALADLFPEMVETASTTKDSRGLHLLLQALGVMFGIGLMLTIGLLEEDLMAALSSLGS